METGMSEDGFARLVRLAREAGLPEVEPSTSYGDPALKVGGKGFVTLKEQGLAASRLPMEQKEFLLEVAPEIYFETERYKGWPWLLMRLEVIADAELAQRLVDAWRFRAPKKLAAGFGTS
jgi:hypothetical protein